MKIGDYWDAYYTHTGKASDVARQLSLAGLALIWLFAPTEDACVINVPQELQPAAVIFVAALAADLLQYSVASIIWGVFCLRKERSLKGPSDDPDIDAPAFINVPANVLFVLKLACVGIGYFFLLRFFWSPV